MLKQGLSYASTLLLDNGTYFIYENDLSSNLQEMREIEPTINCSFKLISNVIEYDHLVAKGYDLKMRFRSKLKKGALAFCVFIGESLVREDWVALNGRAKRN